MVWLPDATYSVRPVLRLVHYNSENYTESRTANARIIDSDEVSVSTEMT